MIADRNTIKSWFQRGMKPLATQFAAWIDSYWHKTDTIPTASIEGLETTLNKKAEQTDVNNLYADFIIHRADDAKHKTEAEQDKLNNLAANPNATYATREELEQLSGNSMIIIPADFTKGTAEMEAEIIATVQERLTDGTLFKKPVYLLYKWKKDYTSEDAPVYYALVSKSDEKRTEGSTYPNVQMYFNSSIVVTDADAPEYPAAYCIMLNIRGEQVRIDYQQYADQHPVYAINLTEDGNGIINSADKNWHELYKELIKGNHPQVSLKTPDSGMYCPASYELTSLDESLASPIYTGTMEISYVKETEGRQELWVETRVFTDLSAATGTYNWENYLKKYSLTVAGGGELIEGDTKDCITTFPDQEARTNIVSGEKHSVLFGKIKRWFADLKAVAFTGRAADLSQDAANRFVSDSEKAGWNDKYTRTEVDDKDGDVLKQAKEYADAKDAKLVGSAPETLNALDELAAALGNDPHFATSIMALIGGKADLAHVHTKSQITDFPAALPANGGNADTVGGFGIDDLGKIINAAIADIDNMPGFFSGFWNAATAGNKPGDYGTVLQVANKYGLPNGGKEVWVFQIAHVHGIDRPMWRQQYNNGGWSSWQQIALIGDVTSKLSHIPDIMDANDVNENGAGRTGAATTNTPTSGLGGYLVNYTWDANASHQMFFSLDPSCCFTRIKIGGEWQEWKPLALANEVLGNTGDQVLNNGRLSIKVNAPEHVIMFKDANGNIGYIGFGGYPKKDIHIYNYESGKFVNIAADGKLYYDGKELAFKGDIGGETLMLDTRDTPEAVQNNISVYKATNIYLSTYEEIPRIGISIPEEMGFTGGQRLWAIGAAQLSGAALVFTFSGLDSSDMVQYFKVVLTNTGLLTITPVPH